MSFFISPFLGPQSRQLTKTGLLVNASGTYFTVAGGRVRILEIFFQVTTVIGAGATTLALSANVVGTDSALCTASAALATKAVDTLLVCTGDPTAALAVSTGEGAIRGSSLALILNPCTIDSVIAGGTTGALTGFVLWQPIDAAATIT